MKRKRFSVEQIVASGAQAENPYQTCPWKRPVELPILGRDFNPTSSSKSEKARKGPFRFFWWRRRELNPRPLALGSLLYMLRLRLLI